MIKTFLNTYGLKNEGVKLIRNDQGGEFDQSQQFRDTVYACGYQVEITGADNSSQNGKAECPHRTLANMMRATLKNAGIHPKYWSDALLQSTFVKNRLPHSAFDFKSTPYTELTGVKPNLQHLQVFCSQITVVTSLTADILNNFIVLLSHPDAIILKQATTKAAGYDLYSVDTVTLQSGCIEHMHTGIKIQLPRHTYSRIASCTGSTVKHNITTEGGVIDPDYTGEI